MKRLVVRLTTNIFFRKEFSAISCEQRLTVIKSKSQLKLRDVIDDPEEFRSFIEGLGAYKDGLYILETINGYYDHESETYEDYDLNLVPFTDDAEGE